MKSEAGHWWLTPIILATQEAEIRRVTFRSQTQQMVCETLSRKNPSQKRAGRVAQGVGPEFKPQYQKKKKSEARSFVQTILRNRERERKGEREK
jgi:hypothetical protein